MSGILGSNLGGYFELIIYVFLIVQPRNQLDHSNVSYELLSSANRMHVTKMGVIILLL